MGEAQRQLGVVTGASPCGVRHDKPVCLYGPLEGVTSRHTMQVWLPPTVLLKEQGRRSQFVLADTRCLTICRSLRCLNRLRNRGRFGRGYFLVAGFIYPRSRVFSPAPCNRCTPLLDCVVLHLSRMTSYLYGSRTRDSHYVCANR